MYIDDNYVGDIDEDWNHQIDTSNLQLHKASDGKTYCINGTHPKYPCMMNDHLINTIKMIKRLSEEGLVVENSFIPVDFDMASPPTSIYGDEVLNYLKYNRYIKEAKKRKIL